PPCRCAAPAGAADRTVLDRVPNAGGGGDRTLVFSSKSVNALASGSTLTLTYSSAAEGHVTADEFLGIVSTDKFASATGTAAGFSSGATATTAQPAELLYGALGQESGNAPTWAAGWTALPTLSIGTDR